MQQQIESKPLKATHTGELCGMQCYVLEDGTAILSGRQFNRALTGGAKYGNLKRHLDRLSNLVGGLDVEPNIKFLSPGGPAIGLTDEACAKVITAYVTALVEGKLRKDQIAIGMNAFALQKHFMVRGLKAAVYEATSYSPGPTAERDAFSALLRKIHAPWDRMWNAELADALERLHGRRYHGGAFPRALGSTIDAVYRMILNDDVCDELKARNPDPSHGKNHHQLLTDETRQYVAAQLGIVLGLARVARDKDEFWENMRHHFLGEPKQMRWN